MKARHRLVVSVLLAFTVWPLAHLWLVERYELNPWKLAGWGMYSAPQLPVRLQVSCITPDEIGRYELGTFPVALQADLEEFLARRRVLGRLESPARLAGRLLEHYTAIDGVEMVVSRSVLNRSSGMIEATTEACRYDR